MPAPLRRGRVGVKQIARAVAPPRGDAIADLIVMLEFVKEPVTAEHKQDDKNQGDDGAALAAFVRFSGVRG